MCTFSSSQIYPLETDMPHRRLTCHWRLIGDHYACGIQSEFKDICISLNILIFMYVLLIYIYWNNVRTLIRHVGLWWVFDYECRSPMCLQLSMYVGLWSGMSVSGQTCWSSMGCRSGMSVSDGHVGFSWISNEVCLDLRSGMLVCDGYPIGLRWVSDNNNIFVNSTISNFIKIINYIYFRPLKLE